MAFNMRWPIGLMFTVVSVLSIIKGLITGPGEKSLGINVGLRRGLALPMFGLLMLPGVARGVKTSP